ncbi:hypothetical protein BD779DRAFT_1684968 [Infundibulicybe gibba]|nr:hypothetical protein BD779DRAFT_1684968 [Infundibulicybe gibba]
MVSKRLTDYRSLIFITTNIHIAIAIIIIIAIIITITTIATAIIISWASWVYDPEFQLGPSLNEVQRDGATDGPAEAEAINEVCLDDARDEIALIDAAFRLERALALLAGAVFRVVVALDFPFLTVEGAIKVD